MVHTNCQFRDKHAVGGIVFYKHAFLVVLALTFQSTVTVVARFGSASTFCGTAILDWGAI